MFYQGRGHHVAWKDHMERLLEPSSYPLSITHWSETGSFSNRQKQITCPSAEKTCFDASGEEKQLHPNFANQNDR